MTEERADECHDNRHARRRNRLSTDHPRRGDPIVPKGHETKVLRVDYLRVDLAQAYVRDIRSDRQRQLVVGRDVAVNGFAAGIEPRGRQGAYRTRALRERASTEAIGSTKAS